MLRLAIQLVPFLLAAALAASSAISRAQPAESPSVGESDRDVEMILFITADGFRTDYVEWYDPPNIRKLIRNGTRVRDARPVFPTNTTPNMASLATGAFPRTSRVANNQQYDREQDRIVGGVRPAIPTIGHMLSDAGWRTAAVSHFVFETRGVDAEMYFDAQTYTLDTAGPVRVADATIELIENRRAEFIAINFGATDSVGHRFGPHSPEIEEMVLAVDTAIGRILDALKAADLFDKTLITMNSDHGMSEHFSKQASMEPWEALQEAGFAVAATEGPELTEETEIVVLRGGVRIVYFRKELSEERMQLALESLEAIEGVEVMDSICLRELHCHPELSGDLIVHPAPGYTIRRAGYPGGLHGRLTEADPILLFHGPGIRRNAWVERADNVDVVPTLLHIVGVPPAETVDGRVIWGALDR